jgi:peptidyl-prolyl cis-trans isomerase C
MTAATRFYQLAREPLVHFLLAGLAVFAFSAWRGEPVDPASRTIDIDAVQVGQLGERFAQTWRRAPSPTELDGLIKDHIKEEIYYREALRLGLEADDVIIRRRLRSKMEYLARAQAENIVADDATLQAWLDRNVARYANGGRLSFDHVYLGVEGSASDTVANYVKAQLARGADWRAAGEPLSIPRSIEQQLVDDVARIFGSQFAAALAKVEPGTGWIGPISSGYGHHLVRFRERQRGAKPALAEVRQRVENDWRADSAKKREAKAYQLLLDGYTIRIAKP